MKKLKNRVYFGFGFGREKTQQENQIRVGKRCDDVIEGIVDDVNEGTDRKSDPEWTGNRSGGKLLTAHLCSKRTNISTTCSQN